MARMRSRRTALGVAIAALLLLAVVALATGGGDESGQLVSGGALEPSTSAVAATTATVTALPPSSTVPTAPASTTATTSPAVATTSTVAPSAAPVTTSRPVGQQLRSVAGGHAAVQAALEQARDRWAKGKPPAGYRWSYRNDCFCSPRQVEVDVDGAGTVTAVRTAGTAEPLSSEQGRNVDAAFSELQQAIDADAASINVRFDPDLGFPRSYYLDRSERLADEEQGLTVLAFSPRT